jgi:hypothetical protein
MHKLMCIVLSAVMIALCRAIRVVCLHDVSMIAIGVEGADQDEEEPSHHHVAPRMSLPHEPSQSVLCESSGLEVVSSCNSYRKSSEEKSTNLLQGVRNFLFVDVCTKKDGLTLDLCRRLVLGITLRVHI